MPLSQRKNIQLQALPENKMGTANEALPNILPCLRSFPAKPGNEGL